MKRLAFLAATFLATSLHAAHPALVCDYGGDKVCILSADGKIEWQVEAKHPQDCWRLPNGNILFAYVNGAKEMTKDKQVVWEYRQDLKVKNHVKIKQKTAYEIIDGDWSSDVCSSDLKREMDQTIAQRLCLRGISSSRRRQEALKLSEAHRQRGRSP